MLPWNLLGSKSGWCDIDRITHQVQVMVLVLYTQSTSWWENGSFFYIESNSLHRKGSFTTLMLFFMSSKIIFFSFFYKSVLLITVVTQLFCCNYSLFFLSYIVSLSSPIMLIYCHRVFLSHDYSQVYFHHIYFIITVWFLFSLSFGFPFYFLLALFYSHYPVFCFHIIPLFDLYSSSCLPVKLLYSTGLLNFYVPNS